MHAAHGHEARAARAVQAAGLTAVVDADAGARARRQRRGLQHDRRLVLRPYPLPDIDRMVLLAETGPGHRIPPRSRCRRRISSTGASSAGTTPTLSAMQWWDANLIERQDPERLQGYHRLRRFLRRLGIQPGARSRLRARRRDIGRHHVVVVGDGLWKRRFDGDPAIVGRSITIDGEPYEVIGVAPPRFEFPDGAELWAPLPVRSPATAPPRRAISDGHRPADARPDARRGAGGDDAAGRPGSHGSIPEANHDHGVRVYTLHARACSDGGTGPILALVAGVGVLRPADRLRQHRQSAAGARRRAPPRDRGPHRARRRPGTRRSGTADRERDARRCWPSPLGARLRLAERPRDSRRRCPRDIMRFVPGFARRSDSNWRLLGFTLGLALRDRLHLRLAAGAAGRAAARLGRAEGRRTHLDRAASCSAAARRRRDLASRCRCSSPPGSACSARTASSTDRRATIPTAC